jgi:transcription-repair coupling factor (superfamily II helicase)
MSRFRTDGENAAIALGLKDGTVDIVIGTHRLLSKDVHFKRLGLLVVDEEHRFGVAHKERIRALKASVDTMVMTATPIPRTLHMAFAGLRDLSLIATAPMDRRPIRTLVCHDDPLLLRAAIEREIARGGQVFFVHNRVKDIGRVAERVASLVPNARLAVGHGQMREEDLERVMLDFVAFRFDVLVCTSIIESGLDIPRANTIIVNRADTFGLAQLYQLRGRVGRSNVQAHAYLVVPPIASLSDDARERVETLARYTDLGAGFSVATMDLEIRGAGNLLGAEQSGDIAGVGFEMYVELLAEATARLQGEPVAAELEPEMTFEEPGYFPEEFIPDVGQRLKYYKRLASAGGEAEVEGIAAEMIDLFGALPPPAELAVEGMKAKAFARALRVAGAEVSARRFVIHLGADSRVSPETVVALVRGAEGAVRFTNDLKLIVAFAKGGEGGVTGAIRTLRVLATSES